MEKYNCIWEAIEDDPVKEQDFKLRSHLMMAISNKIELSALTLSEVSSKLNIPQSHVDALLNGKINEFQVGELTKIADQLQLKL